jgi:hypothetical protein
MPSEITENNILKFYFIVVTIALVDIGYWHKKSLSV